VYSLPGSSPVIVVVPPVKVTVFSATPSAE
jgi:hypothetical protein